MAINIDLIRLPRVPEPNEFEIVYSKPNYVTQDSIFVITWMPPERSNHTLSTHFTSIQATHTTKSVAKSKPLYNSKWPRFDISWHPLNLYYIYSSYEHITIMLKCIKKEKQFCNIIAENILKQYKSILYSLLLWLFNAMGGNLTDAKK